ncbi:MAG: heme ABC transporter ATP-binding protein [Pseudomonadota bacterium]
MLEAADVDIAYGRMTVVSGATLAVAPGEVLALCGPNGAGKSSLFAALAGELRPRRGTVRIGGADIRTLRAAALAERRAVLEQSPSLSAEFTVAELIGLAIPLRVTPETAEEIVAQTIAEVDLTDHRARSVLRLSGGQRHRAHLGRALAQLAAGHALGQTPCLLLDEPTASLDVAHQIAVMRLARAAAARGAAVAVVLHDLNLAAAFADRTALMDEGRIIADGPPDEVFTADRLTATYGTEITVRPGPGGRPTVVPEYGPEQREEPSHVRRHEPLPRASGRR